MADGTYRFQQPGAGQFYFQTQQHNHHPAHQRHLIRNGTSSPTGRVKFNNTDTPSPSRSPPLNQSPSHNSYTMYSQGHQGQPVMMNGQSHQRFGMPMPKFQHPTHHPHHAQQPHHPHSQSTQNLAHQHNFSGGALSNAAQHFTPAHLQNGTTSNVEDEIEEPMNEHWQQQLQLAAESRQASSPHYYARAVAQQTKGLQLSSNQADPNENGTEERNRATAVKDHRRQDWVALDFGGQGLRALSNGLFHYSFLDKLYLNHNKLKSLPSSIGELKNLTHLDISSNELTEIPEEIGMLTNLKKLLLFDNSLQTLPFELGYLYQLDTLGIEGNPLADVLKSRIMQEGTKSLIKYLKEEMPVHLPPSNRDWLILDETGKNSANGGNDNKFTALTYNTLCDRYATNQQYGYAPSRALAWEFRRDLLLNEIRGHDADIVCLQEIDQGSYHGFFREQLAYNDYKGVYWPKGRAQGMPEEEAKLVDGCATFFKGSKYILLEKNMIHFGQTAVRRPDAKGQDDIYNRLWQKDNIAVIVFLENRLTGERMIVVNAHIYWDPAYKDVKLIQVAIMMEEVTQLAEKYVKIPPCTDKTAFRFSEPEDGKESQGTSTPVEPAPSVEYSSASQIPILVCGDFNSCPGSAVYNLLAHGRMAEEHPDLEKRLYGNLSRMGMSHPFTLKSAYSTIGELSFTNYTPGFTDVIDYIWYSSNTLQVTALLGEVDKEYLKRVPGFPNYHFPSDHLALMAEFSVKSKKNKPVEADFGPQRDKTM
ncbi:Glucose-repressible alcohol dehydrogenase transcriptional effector [Coccidioides posadasii str. Silveira]|uniref:CCR4-Not complex 3'-5'-exoribonuclease subunit Ccr4 n=3 Tax=Coccidioides posadasii TaxID=199306 RepID=E9D3M6_COCPS|nr:glucose-repressible alcohol dehydrogenase, putative [Coccidioides posadasii C735 delta SOWgp]EER24281.1 glucose-repressible alcohol dehydrogenase, putative [Coccidioides posadasii C735 delta SOWgp]EFW18669.1 glucose-repressible alcohol dehydrogenase transcriptional effector [Coccidioides posadasii str. Silveira]KMM65942.1 CCR4 protein [Coccidioides posadasii RMSCC 3488]QVM10844.1 Glucose-repressible alcohol dehydrogenase transcriptional effector [Coccidioides posadasii str. Silveira]|eukprot:XP_003066426.1 glucose-repressible alcohol dehydrogenase, putative [Coccidioides posadasii C735 delta SOWgp]